MTARACPSCSASVPAESRFCSSCGTALDEELTSAPTQTSPADPAAFGIPASSQSSDGGRFLPGQVLDERYRVIGLLGRGGMGEVYRADDLKLGQPVALKFLPEAFSSDPARLERFFNEVRTARQVTHPNVCRVHDLGEVDGHHFLSMEYVDGEDLGTLLRRIGRVPRDKAVQIARQLCAGLAAAHDEGILHRDLKPANVMLDGRGRARITDFGLAGLAETIEGGEILAGTPAYQAPEQLSGKEVSKASDIYALGLVLYELFTGQRAFDASSKAELQQMQQSATPPSLASQVDGIDDSIERTILRCLDPDPRRRPESALAVSAALPGGDPLAAALAAGETPSPEMVADAGEEGALKPWVAVALLLIALSGVVLDFAYRSRHSTLAQIGLPKPADELRVRARQILEEVGYDEQVADTAWGLTSDSDYYDWVERTDDSPDRWSDLGTVVPRPYYLWYRQGPEWLPVRGFILDVWEDYPPSTAPGTADVRLDAEGRLLGLRIIPPAVSSLDQDSIADFLWEPVLELTGIDTPSLRAIPPATNPPFNCAEQAAWTGVYPGQPDLPIRIEACLANGRLAYLETIPPWHDLAVALAEEDVTSQRRAQARRFERVIVPVGLLIFLCILAGGGLLARRNIRLGRADRRGAARLAAFLFVFEMLRNLLEAHFGPELDENFRLLLQSLSQACYVAAMGWLLFVAIEPTIRRVWPQTIISFQRLLSGRFRDPLIGRDILIGSALMLMLFVGRIGSHLTASEPELISGGDLFFLSGIRRWALSFPDVGLIMTPLILMTLLVLLRIVLRKDWLTGLVPLALVVTLLTFADGNAVNAIWFTFNWAPVFFILIRFGLLALMAAFFLFGGIDGLIRVWDPASWYFPYVAVGLLVFLLPLFYGFFISLGERKLFRAELLDG